MSDLPVFAFIDRVLKHKATIALVLSAIVWLTRPHWKPYIIDYPAEIKALRIELADARSQIRVELGGIIERLDIITGRLDQLAPQVFDYTGGSFVEAGDDTNLPKFRPGATVFFHYTIRKNSDCTVVVHEDFYDVNKNVVTVTNKADPVHVPRSVEFRDVAIPVKIPDAPGRYRYSPRIDPIDCPGYGQRKPPSSNIFEVTK